MSSSVTTVYDKTQFVQDVKQWMMFDKQLKLLNEKTKEWRNKKNEATDRIYEYMEKQNVLDEPIQLSEGAGYLKFIDKKEITPLSLSFLRECFHEIIDDPKQIDYILKYIQDHREISYLAELKHMKN